MPPGPSKKATYVPLPDIEIHKAAPSSFMTPPMEFASAPASEASEDVLDDSHKTPNVYINGLPPNFPEDQLFELAVPFGEVKSVRSFTRHVGEKESGYGFVLFETIESAEKCIQSLRRFRNLHPTFSKQVHKIPGTNFAQSSSVSSHSGSSYGQANNHSDDGTFKAKMERLQDPNSTNLYIEGLPLSIDEPSLSALVAPHRIKSSRFFQTRLSNPPRIIAFVRLDTRVGAEDVIERLHGRMVRGWNDSGSRISVRFADTSEQRELRRTERVVKEGDQSPARLTIAQAALLNLHGRDQYRPSPQVPPPIGLNRTQPIGMNYDQAGLHSSFRDFSSNAANYHNNDIVLPPAVNNFAPSINSSSYNHAVNDHSFLAGNQELTPAVLALLNSLRGNNGNDDRYSNFQPAPRSRRGLTQSQLQLLNLGGNMGLSDDGLNAPQHPIIGNGVAQARNGFTATEEYILQAHAAGNGSQRRRPTRLDLSQAQAQSQGLEHSDFSVGMRGIRTQASAVSLPQLQTRQETYHSPRMMGSSLPALQEEFQTSAVPSHQNGLRGHLFSRNTSNANGARLPGERDAGQIPSHGSSYPAQTTSHASSQTSSNRNTHVNQQAHIRSSTLPPHSTSASTNQTSRHYQHSSMSIPKSRNIASDVIRATTTHRAQQHRTNNSISSIASIGENNMYSDHKYSSDNGVGRHHHGHNQKEGEKQNFDVYSHGFPEQDYEVDQSSPPLVSPALTYSSRGSAATLSPATPFIGSFSNQQGVTAEGS
ncbi:hypothetical protein BDZ89DRAFT_733630 [Hymenopellis radicata]|nr:hypothetical protein BDZ89DRAFT_733630 [Hymenopellis radicata]